MNNINDIGQLLEKAKAVQKNAYAPYSNFQVGACIETRDGQYFVGCNVENASYGLSVCAESNAIAAMVAAGKRKIKQIMIVVKGPGISTCCGACRQKLSEFATPETRIYLCDLEGSEETYTLAELLPFAFGPEDLILD